MGRRTKIINNKDIIQLLTEAICGSGHGAAAGTLSGFALSRYRLKQFLEMHLSPQAEVELLDALHDKDPFIRQCVVKAVGCLKPATAMVPLVSALEDQDETVRRRRRWSWATSP
jgi:hypothetical protein